MVLTDTQGEFDRRGIPLAFAGVSRVRRPIQVKLSPSSTCPSVGEFALGASLEADQRGTHMSRFIEALDEFADQPIDEPSLEKLAADIRRRLKAESASVRVSFPFFLEKIAPATKRGSLMDYAAEWLCERGARTESSLLLTVPIGTLCPCSKAISDRGAHNQRGEVRLRCRPLKGFSLTRLTSLIEGCASSPLHTLLKREDEKHVTEQAYDNPAFVEDVVREVALQMRSATFVELLSLEVENFESIHAHNAWCRL